MPKVKQKNKNVFNQEKDFFLDSRHIPFVTGKSRRIYPTWENKEFSLARFVIISPLLVCFISFMILVGSLGIYETYKQAKGIETTGIITACKTQRNNNGTTNIRINYEYTVGEIIYPENTISWDVETCEAVSLGSTIRVIYLESIPNDASIVLEGDVDPSSIFIIMVAILAVLFWGLICYQDIKSWHRLHQLKQQGRLLKGRTLAISISTARDQYCLTKRVLLVQYTFISPKGKKIEATRKKYFEDINLMLLLGKDKAVQLKLESLVGKDINILYVSDDCFIAL